jgi:hypothetical protein
MKLSDRFSVAWLRGHAWFGDDVLPIYAQDEEKEDELDDEDAEDDDEIDDEDDVDDDDDEDEDEDDEDVEEEKEATSRALP